MSVPVIDISGEPRQVVEQIGRSCREIAFLTVVGHGVREALVERTAVAARAFFDLPGEQKLELAGGRADAGTADVPAAPERYPGFGPGTISYVGSLAALYALALRAGELSGHTRPRRGSGSPTSARSAR